MKSEKIGRPQQCLTFCFVPNPPNCQNELESENFAKLQFVFKGNSKFVDFDSNELGSHLENNEKILGNSLDKPWNFVSLEK